MALGALAAVVAALDVLLGVVPGAAGVGHEHGHHEAGDGDAAQQPHNSLSAQDQAGDHGHHNGQQGGGHHLLQGAPGAQIHAGGVVRVGLAFHNAGDLPELAADLHHNGLGGTLHTAHGEGGKDEGEHGADEDTHQYGGVGEGQVQHMAVAQGIQLHVDHVHIADQQGQGGQGGGADGEALAGGVGGQGDAQGGQHAHGGYADAVQALGEERGVVRAVGGKGAAGGQEGHNDGDGDDDNGSGGGIHAQRDSADDGGGGAGLGGVGQILGGLVGVRGVVLGEVADGASAHQTGQNGDVGAPGTHEPVGERGGRHGGQNGSGVGALAEGGEQGALVGVLPGADEEGADDRAHHAHHGHQQRQQHGVPGQVAAGIGGRAQGKGGQDGAHIGLVQVGAHAGHIAHIVAHVIGDGGGVAGVILGDAGLNLAHQVGAHVGGLGEDAAAHTGEQGHEGGAHAEHDHGGGNLSGLKVGDVLENVEPDGDIKQAQAHHGEAHNRAGGEGHVQAPVQALVGGVCGAGVGAGGDLHADEAGQGRVDAAGEEGKGDEPVVQQMGCSQDQQDDKYHGEDLGHSGVLPLQVGVGALANRGGDLLHQIGALGKAEHLSSLKDSEEQRDGGAQQAQPEEILYVQNSHSFT